MAQPGCGYRRPGVRKQKLDPYVAAKLQGGIEVPLAHATTDKVAERLQIAIERADGAQDRGTLKICFGGHELQAPVQLKL